MKRYYVTVNGKSYEVEVEEVNGEFKKSNQNIAAVRTEDIMLESPASERHTKNQNAEIEEVKTMEAPVARAQEVEGEKIECPMPGTIIRIEVSHGDSVKKGDVLMVLEAMKMENEIMSPRDCKILSVNIPKGASVNTGDLLMVIE